MSVALPCVLSVSLHPYINNLFRLGLSSLGQWLLRGASSGGFRGPALGLRKQRFSHVIAVLVSRGLGRRIGGDGVRSKNFSQSVSHVIGLKTK